MGDNTGGSASGSDGDASGTPLAAAAAAAAAAGDATSSGSGMKSGEADHGADEATVKGGVEQRPPVALSAEAPPFRPQRFVASPPQPAFRPPPQQFFSPPPLPFSFGAAAPGQHVPFYPYGAMERGSVGYNYNFDLPATGPGHQLFAQSASPSTHWPVFSGSGSGSGSGSRPPSQYPSSPGLEQQCPPAHPAHSTSSSGEDQTLQASEVFNLNLPLRRKAYIAPKSQSVRPRVQSTTSASGAGKPKLSYSALAKHGLATGEEMDKWKTRMLSYLKSDVSYKERASASGGQLELKFRDILVKDTDLAIQLCNTQGLNHYWLHQAAKDFYTECGVVTASGASFHFKKMPTRLTAVSKVLKSSPLSKSISVCNKEKIIEVATVFGRQTADVIICSLLDKLAKGKSWCGNLSIEDLMLAEYSNGRKKLIITKDPVFKGNSTLDERLDDLWCIWRAVQPFYLVGNQLPLYFGRLQKDLFNARYLDDWFVQYIRYHPAFYASNPRKNLICGIQLAASSKTISNSGLSGLFRACPFPDDWRLDTKNRVLYSIFSYKERKEQERKEKEQKLKGGVVECKDISLDSNQYVDNAQSLLSFQRNGLQHPYDHALMLDKDEMELLLAATFEDFLPDMIRGLLSICNMDGQFASDWSTYRASKSDDKEPPFVGGPDSKEGH